MCYYHYYGVGPNGANMMADITPSTAILDIFQNVHQICKYMNKKHVPKIIILICDKPNLIENIRLKWLKLIVSRASLP